MFAEYKKALYFGDEVNYTTFNASKGVYRIECWGAMGYKGGCGGYVSGYIEFEVDTVLHLYIGGIGTDKQENFSFNGGGPGQRGGGGATDIRIEGGNWDSFESLKTRIIVAGGVGGSDWDTDIPEKGGAAGGLQGFASLYNQGQGGTQTEGGAGLVNGSFGKGGGTSETSSYGNGCGGSGYFGGGSSNISYLFGGGGGSSFISGHEGCDAILSNSTESNIIMSGQSVHYLNYRFYHTDMIDGNSYMPSPKGGYENGHCSYGSIRIHSVQKVTCNNNNLISILNRIHLLTLCWIML